MVHKHHIFYWEWKINLQIQKNLIENVTTCAKSTAWPTCKRDQFENNPPSVMHHYEAVPLSSYLLTTFTHTTTLPSLLPSQPLPIPLLLTLQRAVVTSLPLTETASSAGKNRSAVCRGWNHLTIFGLIWDFVRCSITYSTWTEWIKTTRRRRIHFILQIYLRKVESATNEGRVYKRQPSIIHVHYWLSSLRKQSSRSSGGNTEGNTKPCSLLENWQSFL